MSNNNEQLDILKEAKLHRLKVILYLSIFSLCFLGQAMILNFVLSAFLFSYQSIKNNNLKKTSAFLLTVPVPVVLIFTIIVVVIAASGTASTGGAVILLIFLFLLRILFFVGAILGIVFTNIEKYHIISENKDDKQEQVEPINSVDDNKNSDPVNIK